MPFYGIFIHICNRFYFSIHRQSPSKTARDYDTSRILVFYTYYKALVANLILRILRMRKIKKDRDLGLTVAGRYARSCIDDALRSKNRRTVKQNRTFRSSAMKFNLRPPRLPSPRCGVHELLISGLRKIRTRTWGRERGSGTRNKLSRRDTCRLSVWGYVCSAVRRSLHRDCKPQVVRTNPFSSFVG